MTSLLFSIFFGSAQIIFDFIVSQEALRQAGMFTRLWTKRLEFFVCLNKDRITTNLSANG